MIGASDVNGVRSQDGGTEQEKAVTGGANAPAKLSNKLSDQACTQGWQWPESPVAQRPYTSRQDCLCKSRTM